MKKTGNIASCFVLLCVLTVLPLSAIAFNLSQLTGTIDDEVIYLLENLPPNEAYPDASVIAILDEKVDEVQADGSRRSTLHEVFKVLTDEGRGYAHVEIGYNANREKVSIEYARSITPWGKVIPLSDIAVRVSTPYGNYPSYSDYRVLTFSLHEVAVGSIIDYKVVVEELRPAMAGAYASKFYFQGHEPTIVSRFQVITPEDMDLEYSVRNPLTETKSDPQVSRKDGKKISLWEYRYIPQIIPEYNMPPLAEIACNIRVTTLSSWKEFIAWWNELKDRKTEANDAIREKVAALTAGLETPEEKAAALFFYIEREIRYVSINLGQSAYEPATAPEVFANQYGDCKDKSTLLISMLEAAGIPAYYVLIPTHAIESMTEDFPYPFQFNHCIVAIEGEKGYHFLDPTTETYPFGYLPSSNQDRDCLLLKEPKGVFAHTPQAQPLDNGVLQQQIITIRADGSIAAVSKVSAFGDYAATDRTTFIDYGPTELREHFERAVTSLDPKGKLIVYQTSDPFDFEIPFTRTYRYTAERYCKRAGDLLMFPLPGVSHECLTLPTARRRYAIEFPSVSFLTDEAQIMLPEGYEVYYLPTAMDLTTPSYDFRCAYQYEENSISYHGELIRKNTSVPLEAYPDYRTFCYDMERGTAEWIVLKRKTNRSKR
jgi:transglutaminase-like putative cysteine protease